jgi:imidazolonepropionase-like amidohydrolase
LELPRPTPPPLLVQRVRVLDFPPKAGPADAAGGFGPETSLFIEQGRIRWMGSERGRELPRKTAIIDAGGRFAIPGLFDMHQHTQHIGAGDQEPFLAYGVTAVRNPGDWLPGLNAVADRSQATNQPVPRYFFAGAAFHGVNFPWHVLPLRIYTEEDARTYVRRWKERGARFIKAYIDLSWPLQRAVAEEARRLGLPVAGHSDYLERVTKSVTLGYASLEHIPNSDRLYDDVLQMLALAGTRWVPTLGVRKGNALLVRDEPERLADAKFRAFTPEWRIRAALRSVNQTGDKAVRGYWMEKLASIRAAHRRGVKLLVGAHPPSWGTLPLHWELEYFVQADIPPLEVLRIATQEAAAAVGAEDDLGTLELGKLADIVLLDKNPLEDIRNTQTIWRVIKGGWLFDPEKLRPPVSTSAKK